MTRPEPGDRVRMKETGAEGTFVRLVELNGVPNGNYVVVQWDGEFQKNRQVGRHRPWQIERVAS